MKKKCTQKYVSCTSARKVESYQKKLQLEEFVKKGRKAKKIHFYTALDRIITKAKVD